MILHVGTPHPSDHWTRRTITTSIDDLMESFIGSGIPAMHRLAEAVLTLHPDPTWCAAWRPVLTESARPGPKPAWMAGMADITITGAESHGHLTGDGENVAIGWRWPDGSEAVALVYVDFNHGTTLRDGFTVPDSLTSVGGMVDRSGRLDGIERSPLDLAEARARIEEARRIEDMTVPPTETDSWPGCRALIDWVVRQLPEGGVGYERPEWSEPEREALLDDFVASPFGVVGGLSPADVRGLADPLVWYGCDYGPGDPLRWSPTAVEIILTDWYARKVHGISKTLMKRVPDVLASFVRYCHDRRGWPRSITTETMRVLDNCREEYLADALRPGRSPFDGAARLARVAAGLDPDDFDEIDTFDEVDDLFADGPLDADDLGDVRNAPMTDDEYMASVATEIEQRLITQFGSAEAVAALNDAPLTAVPFDWTRIPQGARALTTEALEHIERWAPACFDAEVAVIAGAALSVVVRNDPSVFKRSLDTRALAAAVLMTVSNKVLPTRSRRVPGAPAWAVSTQKALADATGVPAATISARCRTVTKVIDADDTDWSGLLHSHQRRQLIIMRDLVADWRASRPA